MNGKIYEIKCIVDNFGIIGTLKLLGIKYKMSRDSKEKCEYNVPINNMCKRLFFRSGTSDWGLLRSFFWDPHEKMYDIDFREYNLTEVNTIVDAGANIGLFSVKMSTLFPTARYYCIEPEESNYVILSKNVRNLNSKVFKCGLWNKKAKLKVTTTELSSGTVGYVVEESDDTDTIDSLSIDSLIKDENLESIDILKMDIEGSEFPIFFSDSYKEWIDKVKMIIAEIHEDYFPGGVQRIVSILDGCGFKHTKSNEDIIFYR